MTMTTVKIMPLPHAQDVAPKSPDEHGRLDLVAVLPANASVIIAPGDRGAIPTGLAFAVPPGHEAQIRTRSGLALHHGVIAVPTAVDGGYRGELHIILVNLSDEPFTVKRGDRIAYLVVAPVLALETEEVAKFDELSDER